MNSRLCRLRSLAKRLRLESLAMVHEARGSHIGGSFSMAEILAVLYGEVLRIDPRRAGWEDRDRFILSKGHACAAFYAALAERGFFPKAWLRHFCRDGGRLPGHATREGVPGVELSTGSLGHGLAVGCGMALAALRDGRAHRTFVLLGDGECDEGSTWESALFAGHHKLDRLVAIIDHNKIQSMGRVSEVMDLRPLARKWIDFGWDTREVDGHDVGALLKALSSVPFSAGRPSCLVAHTVKGKGVSFMEDKLLWHYKSPSPDEYARAVAELKAG